MNTALYFWRLRAAIIALLFLAPLLPGQATAQTEAPQPAPTQSTGAEVIYPHYPSVKVVYDFYFDQPDKINSGLYWIRSLIQPLMDSPYNEAPEMMNIVVVIHGTEIVTLAKKNYQKYKEAVERMRYYHQLGVQFHVCGLAMHDFDYTPQDMQDFVKIVPSAFTDLAGLQQEGYALITPRIFTKQIHIQDIR